MNALKLTGFLCPYCNQPVPTPDDSRLITIWQCYKCDAIYEAKDEAEECCKLLLK